MDEPTYKIQIEGTNIFATCNFLDIAYYLHDIKPLLEDGQKITIQKVKT